MTYLSTENLSKNYGPKVLFQGLSFGITEGDKTALIAENGTGKSTLLKILAGEEQPDGGKVMVQNDIRIGFLEQDPNLDENLTIREFIAQNDNQTVEIIQQYHQAAEQQAEDYNEENRKKFERASEAMDTVGAWDYEQRMEKILSKLNIHNLDQSIATLSGGERKRVALAFVLLDNPDLLILDEPTNHLDIAMIEWLEEYLISTNRTLLMVTHDRYFLDRICDHILELEGGKLYHHKGNYQYFLEKRSERREIERKEAHKAQQLFKKELEWMRRSPKARTTKSKSRIDDFKELKDKTETGPKDPELRLSIDMPRLGGKILELKNVSKKFDDNKILDSFYYTFEEGERIGIIGENGAGKSTFLDMITGKEQADSGKIRTGKTVVFGHYEQQGLEFDEDERVIDIIQNEAKIIKLANGKKITASRFLEHFMFTSEMQYTHVRKLSGGEKRRLALMLVLIQNPNFLILDEPTNDLDLLTLNKLEEFLLDFEGCLIIVSHDRFFMDKLVDHYFIFEGEGQIRDHHGTYEEYREQILEEQLSSSSTSSPEPKQETDSSAQNHSSSSTDEQRLSYNERREYNKLEENIAKLEQKKEALETEISSGKLSHDELQEKSKQYEKLNAKIEKKTSRWFELAERA
ncbi:ABC-F family ATP-binding cassette domain-containing protein [Aliifodinibius salicampi]|uniref:ABC-F family ATP-binding cassette domain-containing protein n=1 Tax=Fodinibius salicampi TaxID=1920655 RepID=A0ABT3PVA1_9BACT|nr:ABC-F family ATP-binding cassette domain-containing protein [Fodinibius salicampi]MCW9711789.1 ABC-F family ATP-binding cassette domain-containing protein [Fodinibius salicampi]